MSAAADLFAILAIVPAMTGAPVPQEPGQGAAVRIAMCSGGTIALALGGTAPPVRGTAPCCAKGCHAPDRRRKLDREQGKF